MATPLTLPKPVGLKLNLLTWVIVLLVSELPNAIWQAVIGEPPAWLFWAKIALLLVLVLAGAVWKPIQVTRNYFLLLCVLMLTLWGMNTLRTSTSYIRWEQAAGWVAGMAAFQGLKLSIALVMLVVLLLLGRHPREFFFTTGQVNAPVMQKAVPVQPRRRYLSWGVLGLLLGIVIAPLTFLFFNTGSLPGSAVLLRALPLFPVALLFAATNAFAEEVQFRASLLGDLQTVIGAEQAIWLTAAFFGLAHFFSGPPSGVVGVLIAGVLGALFAKCMLGSKGILVPWFIHFCQNAVIYAFWAISAAS